MNKILKNQDLQSRLDQISSEMLTLIQKYNLGTQHPLDIIPTAKAQITDKGDYIRFIELSLEGRLIGETFHHAENTQDVSPETL